MKQSAILLFTMLLWLLASGCNDGNEPSDFDVTGNWTMTAQSPDGGKTWTAWTLVPTVVVYNPDGRFYTDGYFGEHNGRWTRNGNVITATSTGDTEMRFRFESVSGNAAQIHVTTLYGAMWVKAEKQ